jgi:hypothetical protein
MAFALPNLDNYVKTNEQMLIIKSFFTPKTASYMQKLTGVKSAIQVPSLTDDFYWGAGGTCGLLQASGDTTISARNLTVGKVKIEKSWCIATLEAKYTQLLLSPGSNYESLPGGIDEAFVNFILGSQGEKVEIALWQSVLNGTAVDYTNKFDGLIEVIRASTGKIDANVSAFITPVTAVTVSNIISVLQATYQAIPAQILDKEDLRIFVGQDWSRLYQSALVNSNAAYNVNNYINTDATGEYFLMGTNVKIVPVPGLNGTNKAYALRTSNMFLGCDLESEEDEMKMWYSQDYDSVFMRMKFKLGTQISQPTEVVRFTL